MLVYACTRDAFLADVQTREIEFEIARSYLKKVGQYAPAAQMRAWRHSLEHMALVLEDEAMDKDMGVGVELGIPQSSKRIDFILSGKNDKDHSNLIIVELKQWSSADLSEKDGLIFANRGGSSFTEGPHPSYQAWSYASLLQGFSEPVHANDVGLSPCAYLHNYVADGVIDHPSYAPYIAKAPLFLRGDFERDRLRQFIKDHVRKGDKGELLYSIESGRVRPSKMLADSLAGMLKGNDEFVLIDEQKTVFEHCVAAARVASPEERKVVVVKGGPGTGKSVLAINLLSRLLSRGLNARYVSKNAAPRTVYAQRLAPGMRRVQIDNLFSGSGGFHDARPDAFDVLIVDEAHRLNLKSGLYGNLGENQAKEIMACAPCTIFFVDDDQIVTLQDIGTSEQLVQWALEQNADVLALELESQFRCGGSDDYLSWIDSVLEVRETAVPILKNGIFDFRVFDSPSDMHAEIAALNEGRNRSRVVAGYCWDWLSKRDPNAMDIVIAEGSYERQWNLDLHGSAWIAVPESIEQVGCIHTCQGLELDYVGVIVGPDLVFREGRLIANPKARSHRDKTIRGYKTLMASDPMVTQARVDRIIRNTYRTLMTRGMKGCFIYCVDAETRDYFRSKLESTSAVI